MGLIQYSVLVDKVVGKVGNVVFQNTDTVRKFVVPVNPRTAAQLAQRANVTTFATAWPALSESQRLAWNSAAASGEWARTNKVGRTFNPTGEQLFMELNLNIAIGGGSQISTPPTKASFASITLSTLTAAAGTPAFTVAYVGTLGTNQKYVISATKQLSPGRMSVGDPDYREIAVGSGTSPVDILSAYTAINGALTAAKKVFVKLELVNSVTGQRQTIKSDSVIIAS